MENSYNSKIEIMIEKLFKFEKILETLENSNKVDSSEDFQDFEEMEENTVYLRDESEVYSPEKYDKLDALKEEELSHYKTTEIENDLLSEKKNIKAVSSRKKPSKTVVQDEIFEKKSPLKNVTFLPILKLTLRHYYVHFLEIFEFHGLVTTKQ